MKKILVFLIVVFAMNTAKSLAKADSMTVNLVRMFSQDIFETNGKPYLKPMVESMNATSNSRFFNNAYVPKKVNKPYFRVSVNSMVGLVPDDMKTYTPTLPMEKLDMNQLGQYLTIDWSNGTPQITSLKDTAGLVYYALKTIFYDAVQTGDIKVPSKSATILGSQNEVLSIPNSALKAAMQRSPAYAFLPQSFKDSLDKYIKQFPETFSLPKGANMNTFVAAIPQFEIGSLWGTEALIRFIPPIDMGENIGDFSFWGIGLKHSISQYFTDYSEGYDESALDYDGRRKLESTPFDMAVQVVYQGTYLKNTIGVTGADLTAWANFWDFNIQFSKRLEGWFDIYSGFSYEIMSINSDYVYSIPWETQIQLGLVTKKLDANCNEVIDPKTGWNVYEKRPPEFPGDEHPQTSHIKIDDTNFKWVIGISKDIGKFSIFADYNVSTFNIFTGGVSYRF